MRFNISGRHTFGIYGQYLFFYILRDTGLILFQQLRFKFAVSVSERFNFDIPETSLKGLLAMTVSTVSAFLVFVVVLAVTQFII